jgi:large subunit ribosomal protein L23
MALKSIYNVIQGPVISDKAYKLNKDLKKLVLFVHPDANKPLIKEALKKLFNVEVEDVRIVICKGKRRRAGRKIVEGSDRKKAIVTPKAGYSINLFDQAGEMNVVAKEREELQ